MSEKIRTVCLNCNVKLSVPKKLVGTVASCPKCKSDFFVSADSSESDVFELACSPTEDLPQLVECPRCKSDIAIDAEACMNCGAPNKWVHPEIERFLDEEDAFANMPPFRFSNTSLGLSGFSTEERGPAALGSKGVSLFCIGMLLLVLTPLKPIGSIMMIVGIIMMIGSSLGSQDAGDEFARFEIDFSKTPPAWQSNDDSFWEPIKAFFNLP